MSTLKSALRFPPARPPPPPPPPEPQYPNLTSRFSVETLVIKSSPRSFQRIFTSANSTTSPPASPLAPTKRYPRRSSSTVKRHHPHGDARASSDESRTSGRPSLDEQRRPRRANSGSRGRTASGGSTTAAEKLAGAAKEVIEKLASRRLGHARQRSGASEASIQLLASARSRPRSISSPSPVPSRPVHGPQRPDSQHLKLVDLPPRSDSRNAAVADIGPPSIPAAASSAVPNSTETSRPNRLPALAANRPRPKRIPPPLPLHQRPISAPSPSVPPLRPLPSLTHAAADVATFKAMLVKPPTFAAVTTKSVAELLFRVDIGGQSSFTTTVETLLTTGNGGNAMSGKLGEFVESILEDVRRNGAQAAGHGVPSHEHEAATAAGAVSMRYLDVPGPRPSDDDSSTSSLSRTPSFAPSPLPASPFPFADDCTPSEAAGEIVFAGAEDPASPIDPLVSTAAAVLAAKNILAASRYVGGAHTHALPPPLEPLNAERTPDYCASIELSDAFQRGLGPFFDVVRGQAHESLALLSPPSWPVDSSPSPSSPVTAAMIPAKGEGPHFQHDVVIERASLDYGLSDEALEGISGFIVGPDALGEVAMATSDAQTPSLCSSESAAPRRATSSSGTPATRHPARPVSLDDSTLHVFLDRTDAALPTTIHGSDLDASSPVQLGNSTYGCLFSFFRLGGRLPPSLVLPHGASTSGAPDVDPLYLSLFALNPSPLFALLTALRSVEAEGRWLGCGAVQSACAVERGRVQRVVEWLSTGKAGGQRDERDVRRGEEQLAKAGWI